MQCGVELHSSLTLALPRTVKVTLAFSVPTVKVTRALLSAPQRWGDDGNPPTLPHSGHGVRYVAPRGGYRLLSPAREYGGGECSCEAGTRSNNEGALRE